MVGVPGLNDFVSWSFWNQKFQHNLEIILKQTGLKMSDFIKGYAFLRIHNFRSLVKCDVFNVKIYLIVYQFSGSAFWYKIINFVSFFASTFPHNLMISLQQTGFKMSEFIKSYGFLRIRNYATLVKCEQFLTSRYW